MILPIAIFSVVGIVFIVLSFMMGKAANSGNREVYKIYAGLLRVFGVAILIIGNSYAVLDSKGWDSGNVQNFKLIILFVVCFSMVMLGIRFFRLGSAGIARTSALAWIVMWLGVTGYGYKLIGDASQGWNEEQKNAIINKCPALEYERLCYLEQVMKKYPNPEDYNKMSSKGQEELNKSFEKHCKLCDEEREKKNTKVIDGLPEGF